MYRDLFTHAFYTPAIISTKLATLVMPKFNQRRFNQFIFDHHIIGFFPAPIKLASGRLSSWYVNWRNIAQDVFLLDQVSDFVLDFCWDKKIGVDCFYGVPEGATKLGLLCQYKWAKSRPDYAGGKYVFAMGRGKPKDHGDPKDREFVGQPQGRIVVLEDVTTTGGSLIKTVKALKGMGLNIAAAIALTNRNERNENGQTVAQYLENLGVKYYSLSSALELLPQTVNKMQTSIEEEFSRFGEKEISWK